MPLDRLAKQGAAAFPEFLNTKTAALALLLPRPEDNVPNWGAARKVINIYLRKCAMNKDLHPLFHLQTVEPLLEVPLDSHVVDRIDAASKTIYARAFRIKTLTPPLNTRLQNLALDIAESKSLFRYELDVLFWRKGTGA